MVKSAGWLLTFLATAMVALTQPGSAATLEARAELLALHDARSADLARLVPLIAHGDATVRAGVAAHLGGVPWAGAAPVVARLLGDSHPAVRAAAAMAAGRLLRDLPAQEPRRRGLAKSLRQALFEDPHEQVRAAAAWGIAAAAEAAAETVLVRALKREKGAAVRAAVLAELWRLPGTRWVEVASRALDRRFSERERFAATWSLARGTVAEGSEGAAALRRAAADPDPLVRATALTSVRRGATVDLWDFLVAGVTDPSGQVRQAALDSLAAVLEREGRGRVLPKDVGRRIQELLASLDPELVHERVLAVRVAGLAGCCARDLERLAQGDDLWLAEEALLALARLGVQEPVQEALGSPLTWRRLAGVRAARHLRDGATVLRTALGDAEVGVRLAAVEELAALGGEGVAAALGGLVGDADGAVRAAAVEKLASLGAAPPREELLALLRLEAVGGSPDAAVALVKVLAAALPDQGIRRELEALTQGGGDPVVARAAWDALGRPGPPPPLLPPEPPEFYRRAATWAAEPRWLELVTVRGSLVIVLNREEAPLSTFRLSLLAESKFFDGLTFHRVVPNFVVQGGDPRGDGWGGPSWTLRDELSVQGFLPGVVGLAHAGPDTAGSQLFVTLTPQPHLNGRYPVLGRLASGLEVAARLRRGDRILRARTGSGEPPHRWPVWYGELSPQRLDTEMVGWREERERYAPAPLVMERLASASLRYGLEVALGTWCADSHEQIPRLQRILAELGEHSPFTSLRLVGVDRSKELAWGHGPVEVVPTIVVTYEGAEVGRILETPRSGSLERDLMLLLAPLEGWPTDP